VPKYFFHVEGGPDDMGVDLPSIVEAKAEAARYLGALLRENPSGFWEKRDLDMWVTDAKGLSLFTIRVMTTDSPSILVIPRAST
jgi:hypothetical protein